jgi:hypothetical protein
MNDDVSALGASGALLDSFSSSSSLRGGNLLTASSRVSYRETQLGKILNAPVVKLPELRKLGWNGIPVRTLT